MAQITSGVVRYLQRINTGDYNHKEASAELSFTVSDGEDYHVGLDLAGAAALTKVNQILFAPKATVSTAALVAEEAPAKPKGKGGRPPKPTEAQLDPTDPRVTGQPDAPVDDGTGIDVVTDQPKPTPAPVEEDGTGLGDILGAEAPKEITDKDIVSAITQHMDKVHNGPAIRVVVAEFAGGPPPLGARDIPQDKRAAFLVKLVTVGPAGK